MSPRAAAAIAAGFAILSLVVLHRVLDPAPLPLATAVLGGTAAIVVARGPRVAAIVAASGAGLGVGAAFHVVVHLSGASPQPAEGLAAHILGDAALGLAIAAAVVLGAALLAGALVRVS